MMKPQKSEVRPVLVTGATGYVGGRLVPKLLDAGYHVRAAGRSTSKLESKPWAKHPNVQIVKFDALDPDSFITAVKGCSVAYYLIHSMQAEHDDFAETDRVAAENMVRAAAALNLSRIIYLGGLGSSDPGLSKHLRSRDEVAGILKQGAVPTTVLRAAMIIGSGSASFEILRYLTDRLPLMITPRWVRTPNQPIAIRNVLEYLVGCLGVPETTGETLDIGGPEVLTYETLMQTYAEEAGLSRRLILPVPVLTPKLSSYWIHLVTPVPSHLARPLAEGLRNPVVCDDNRIRELIPQPLLQCRQAIRLALERMHEHGVETHWTDAGKMPPVEWFHEHDPNWAGGTIFEDKRSLTLQCRPEEAWQSIIRIGGRSGWYYGDWLWKLRGFLDRLVGGVGLNRGRRDPDFLRAGDALDFWRVHRVDPPSRLVLIAEMKLPGQAILEFVLINKNDKSTEIRQNARFLPRGLAGILYWYAVSPLHHFVFRGMLHGIARRARRHIRSNEDLKTRLILDDRSIPVECLDSSAGGCRLRSTFSIPPSTTVFLELPGTDQRYEAAVKRTETNSKGIELALEYKAALS